MKKSRTNSKTFPLLFAAIIGISGACSNNGNEIGRNLYTSEPSEQLIELKAITMGLEPASGVESFYAQMDKLTLRDLNARVRFDFVPWGDEKNQISRAIVAKEYDLYVGGAWSDFSTFAAKNAFIDLTPLLEQTPKLVEHYKGVLERIKIDYKVYGIPQYSKPGAGGEGVFYREDLRKKWGLPAIRDLESLEHYLYRAKDEYANIPMINDKRFADNLWTMMSGDSYYTIVPYYAVAPVDNPYHAISIYDTPEYRQMLEKAKQWYDDGIVDHDILAAQVNETGKTLELMKTDRKPLEFNNHFGAINSNYILVLKNLFPDYEYGWYDFIFDTYPEQVFMPKMSAGNATMISIGSHSAHAETALKFIELAHTDQSYYNLLQFGVEGENYNLVDGIVSYDGIEEKNRRPGWTGLYDGYMHVREMYPDEWQPIYEKLVNVEGPVLAEKNGAHPYEGFVFNTINLASEISAMETIRSQYVLPLQAGITDNIDKDLDEARKYLSTAGIDRYLNELQRQLEDHLRNLGQD